MNINIYSNYKIEMTTKGCEKDIEGFKDFEHSKVAMLTGSDVFELLSMVLESEWLSLLNIDSQSGVIQVEVFNPLTGEGRNVIYKVTEEKSNGDSKKE